MKVLARIISLTIAIGALLAIELPVSATAADVTGTWELTICHPPPDGDFTATYLLKQDGETISGIYQGLLGPADVAGTIKGNDLRMSVTVQSLTPVTVNLSGKVTSATKMSGTVTGTHSSGEPMSWSAGKKK